MRESSTGYSSEIMTHLAQLQRNSRTHLEPAVPVVVSAQSFLQATNVIVGNNGVKGAELLTSFEILRCLGGSGE